MRPPVPASRTRNTPMVTIRLARGGAKKRPFYHLVATDSRKPRDSGHLERLGFFNPIAAAGEEVLRVDQERVRFWLDRGAQTSGRAAQLIRRHAEADGGDAPPAAAADGKAGGKTAEPAAEKPAAEEAPPQAAQAPAEAAAEPAPETAPAAEAEPAAD